MSNNDKDPMGNRMKQYEDCWRIKLPRRIPKIIRLDGRSFHTVLREANKPFDNRVMSAMILAAIHVMADVSAVVAGILSLIDKETRRKEKIFDKDKTVEKLMYLVTKNGVLLDENKLESDENVYITLSELKKLIKNNFITSKYEL